MTDKVQKIREKVARIQAYTQSDVLKEVLSFIDSLQEEPAPKIFEDMLNAKTPAESLGISAEEHDKIVDECLYGKEPELVDFDDMPLDPNIQYASREIGIKAHAEDYSFNIESELFQQLNKEQQELWRKEIEQACMSGGYCGLNLGLDKRYDKEEPVSEDLEEAIEQSFIYHDNRGDDFRSDEQIETAYRYGFETGAKWQKEQMMSKAIDGLVICDKVLTHGHKDIAFSMPKDLKVDDEVKMIIIKND